MRPHEFDHSDSSSVLHALIAQLRADLDDKRRRIRELEAALGMAREMMNAACDRMERSTSPPVAREPQSVRRRLFQ